MADRRVPGVFVANHDAKRIERVDVSTAGFVGATLNGPIGVTTGPFTSLAEFQDVHGGFDDLTFGAEFERNHLALAVRAFFENGGRRLFVVRAGGLDNPPGPAEYGEALKVLAGVSDVSVVAAPGYSARASERPDEYLAIQGLLLEYVASVNPACFAVLDPPGGTDPRAMLALRGSTDEQRAALYYPWVAVADPAAQSATAPPIHTPPSGFVCGVYARVAEARGVFATPANELVVGSLGLERRLTDADAEMLGAAGINTLRDFPGRGTVVWGARTLSSDPEWKYISVRRYVDQLETSISAGLAWTVFEPNDEPLWAEVRRVVGDFLYAEWRAGGLPGNVPEKAFFVRCDRTVMTQEDIDSGRLICVVGLAVVKPAEFVIIRIGQWVSHDPSGPPP